jgi:hypothetical protein
MNKLASFFKNVNKPLLVIASILVLFVLIFGVGFLSLKAYLQKNVYQDFSLILYDEAEAAMGKTWMPGVSKWFLSLTDKMFPEMFVRFKTIEQLNDAFDYTVRPALFKVLTANQESKTLTLEFMLPKFLAELGTMAEVGLHCAKDTTVAGKLKTISEQDLKTAFEQFGFNQGVYSLESVSGFAEQYPIDKPVFAFIVDFLNRDDVKSGDQTVYLRARCTTPLCDFVGPDCEINVF